MRTGRNASPDSQHLLDLLESGWSERLRGRRLVAEAEPEREHDVLAAVAKALLAQSPDAAARRWPACLVFSMTGTAVTDYEAGSPWLPWWRAGGKQTPPAAGRARWERAFSSALAALAMPTFGDTEPGASLLLHTAVPDVFLGALCEALAAEPAGGRQGPPERTLAEPGLTEHDPAEHGLTEHGPPARGPVAELLRQPAAAAFVDRCRDALLDAGFDGDTPDTGLPARLTDAIVAFRAETSDRRAGRAGALALEAFGRGPLRHGPDGGYEPAIPGAINGATVVFDVDGREIAEGRPLPPDTVWLLHPVDSPPDVGGPLRVVMHGHLPLGWSGWCLYQAALEDARWLQPSGPDAARRVVDGRAKPVLTMGTAIDGLFADSGPAAAIGVRGRRPVFADAPALRLPAGVEQWLVEVRGPDARVLASLHLTGADGAATETPALWSGLTKPLLGAFTVRVTGPRGRGMVRTVVLAEGLELQCHPDPRLFHPDGLDPADVVPHPAPGMTVIPAALAFGTGTVEADLRFVTRQRSERFTVSPPRMRARIDGVATGTGVGASVGVRVKAGIGAEGADHSGDARPLRIDVGQPDATGRLRVDVPGARRAPSLELLDGDLVVQRLAPHQDGSYNLARILDTATARPGMVLTLVHDGRRVPVAWLEDRPPTAAVDPWLPRHAGRGGNDAQPRRNAE